jgi:UDP-N-acetylmuramyl pentapeptide synthase
VHLELLGSVENVAAAKFELITSLKPGSTAVVPADEPLLREHLRSLSSHVRVVEFGDQPTINLNMNLSTTWQMRCAAAALECCRALDRMPQEGATIDVALSAMRGSIRSLAVGGTLIEDCYNANPIAMRAALADLSSREGRRVAVLGDMMELGRDEAVYHREIGVAAVAAGVDLVIGVGARATAYVEGAAGVATAYFATVDDAVTGVGEHLRTGDVVLLKGSRSMALERVAAVIAAD